MTLRVFAILIITVSFLSNLFMFMYFELRISMFQNQFLKFIPFPKFQYFCVVLLSPFRLSSTASNRKDSNGGIKNDDCFLAKCIDELA